MNIVEEVQKLQDDRNTLRTKLRKSEELVSNLSKQLMQLDKVSISLTEGTLDQLRNSQSNDMLRYQNKCFRAVLEGAEFQNLDFLTDIGVNRCKEVGKETNSRILTLKSRCEWYKTELTRVSKDLYAEEKKNRELISSLT